MKSQLINGGPQRTFLLRHLRFNDLGDTWRRPQGDDLSLIEVSVPTVVKHLRFASRQPASILLAAAACQKAR